METPETATCASTRWRRRNERPDRIILEPARLRIVALLSGVKEADFEVMVASNRLTVSGKRESEREEKEDTYYTYERSYGSFTRTFTLPDQVDTDQVKAELKAGELTIVVPKSPTSMAKKVQIATSEKPKS